MRKYPRGSLSAAAITAATLITATLVTPVAARAQAGAGPQPAKSGRQWTKISADTKLGIASAGLFRTADGRLHVLWPGEDVNGANTTYALHYSTVGGRAKLLNTGTIEHGWAAIMQFPRLVAGPGGGIRAIFSGGNGIGGNPYNTGAIYTATSNSAGTSWSLGTGSLSHSDFVPLTDDAAATEANGTPVAAWPSGSGLAYHLGIDPAIPANAPDQLVGGKSTSGVGDPTLVRTSSGGILAGWFNTSGTATEGYWVDQLEPSLGTPAKAPDSGGTKQTNGQPFEPVALASRVGGGEYLAYCQPTKVKHCGHIALWRVGASKTLVVPGSASGQATQVAIGASPGGHLWIAWFDTGTNKVSVVRTNAAATRFGPVLTFNPPPKLFAFDGLEVEGSAGPLDVIALEQQAVAHSSPAYFDTQVLPALRIQASPASVSSSHSTQVKFTVSDTGDGVAGVTVRFLGKVGTTNAKGTVTFTVSKGTAQGAHSATASKGGYASAGVTVNVT